LNAEWLQGEPFGKVFIEFFQLKETDPSFWMFAKISFVLTGEAWLMFGLYAVVTVLTFWYGLGIFKVKAKDKWLPMAFFLLVLLPMSMSLIRQFAAVSICFLATAYLLREKNLRKFLLWGLVATIFHLSSAVIVFAAVLIIYFVFKSAKTWKHFLIRLGILSSGFLAARTIGWVLLGKVLRGTKYAFYFETTGIFEGAQTKSLFLVRLVLLVSIAAWMLWRREEQRRRLDAEKMTLIGFIVCSALLFLPVINSDVVGRFGYYFDAFLPILIMRLAGGAQTKLARRSLYAVTILYAILYFLLFYWYRNNVGLFPITTIWGPR
jgi:hypothetical protein